MSDLEKLPVTDAINAGKIADVMIRVVMNNEDLRKDYLAIASSFKDEDILTLGGKYRDWVLEDLEKYGGVCSTVDSPSRTLLFNEFLSSSINNMPDTFWNKIADYFRRKQQEREESGVIW